MKRNGRNMKMPKDGIMTSDVWSRMKNLHRYDYLNATKQNKKKVGKKNGKK